MHWLHVLWFNYFWPSDEGNGPEALQQTVLYALIAAVLIPAVRHWARREMAHIHGKLDHIIFHHPDIPPYPPDQAIQKKIV